jgi:beta-lactamase family protein
MYDHAKPAAGVGFAGDQVTVRDRCSWRPFRMAALAAIAFLGLGCSGTSAAGSGDTPAASLPPSTAGPAVSSTPTSTATPRPAVAPFAHLAGYLAHRSGQVTAAVYDARTKQTWLLHPGVVQDTASIVKVEIMGTALAEAEAAHRDLTQSQAALMPAMIEQSDNDAATTLLAGVGGPSAIGRFDRSIGMTHTTPSTLALIPGTTLPGWGLTTTTALDEVTLVSKFAYPNSALSDAARKYGLGLMENVEAGQNWGVTGGVPAGTTVALKNGWVPIPPSNYWQVNSIGWISGHGRDYVLAVLTDGNPSESYGIETIEAIARAVYADLGGNH